jgi:predicted phosphoribosyltransferase
MAAGRRSKTGTAKTRPGGWGASSGLFTNRRDAGRQLAERLTAYRGKPAVVLALPRGGVPVAAEVAQALGAPIDLVLVRKIGIPFHPELAMGAVADGERPITVRNEDVIGMFGIATEAFAVARDEQLKEIERRRAAYLHGRTPAQVAGRIAIVVDDGVATGATTRAALRSVRARGPSRLVLAVPVGPGDVLQDLEAEADEVVCLFNHLPYGAIGSQYLDFRQVSDDEVADILAAFPPAPAASTEAAITPAA